MDKEKITPTQSQLHRWYMLEMAEVGRITLKEKAGSMGISYRKAKRIRSSVKHRGIIRRLIHGKAGPAPANTTGESKQLYSGLTDTHFTKELLNPHSSAVSRETARKIRRKAGISPPQGQAQSPKKHHKRKEREWPRRI